MDYSGKHFIKTLIYQIRGNKESITNKHCNISGWNDYLVKNKCVVKGKCNVFIQSPKTINISRLFILMY